MDLARAGSIKTSKNGLRTSGLVENAFCVPTGATPKLDLARAGSIETRLLMIWLSQLSLYRALAGTKAQGRGLLLLNMLRMWEEGGVAGPIRRSSAVELNLSLSVVHTRARSVTSAYSYAACCQHVGRVLKFRV